jgi:cyclopropane-fatty-acyl-phospholipid synthase
MSEGMSLAVELAERRWIPDSLIRHQVRRLLRGRLREEAERSREPGASEAWVENLRSSPIALATREANEQHYEVPAEFYRRVLGPHLKYSSALFASRFTSLGDAERAMLELTVRRARLADGQRILELGCGWGSLTLFMARQFPNAEIVAVSNSSSQKRWIDEQARRAGLENVRVVTVDINAFNAEGRFDRVVSVEMFEHVRNWEALLGRVHAWLAPEALVFLHFFAHRAWSYPFEATGEDDWMGRHFFTGGMMPVKDLPERLRIPFEVVERWEVPGEHYSLTAKHWLDNLDRQYADLVELFAKDEPRKDAERRVQRWRIFFMSCMELFGYARGSEWLVSHALLAPRARGGGA